MHARERLDALASSLEAFPERRGLDVQGSTGLICRELQNLAQQVCKPVRPVEALQHPQRAADLHFLREQRGLAVGRSVRRQTALEIAGKRFEAQVLPLDRTLLHVEQVVGRHAVYPRLQPAAKVELRQARDHANQYLLRGIFRILAIPQHPQGKPVDVALECQEEITDAFPPAVHGLPSELLELRDIHQTSINDLSVESS